MAIVQIKDQQAKVVVADATAIDIVPAQIAVLPGEEIAPVKTSTPLAQHAYAASLKQALRIGLRQSTPVIIGLLLLLGLWALIANFQPQLPSPLNTWQVASQILQDPLFFRTSHDAGIFWLISYSLKHTGIGFLLAALIGIPFGFMIGRYALISHIASPIIGLLKPISPLAWLPIGLIVFQSGHIAIVGVVLIAAIWPIVTHTADGIKQVPQAHLNVARMLNLSESDIVSKILWPSAWASILTGLRRALGIAWLVAIATEMLGKEPGIGFWLWSAWQQSRHEHVLIALLTIGMIGFLLEQMLRLLISRSNGVEGKNA